MRKIGLTGIYFPGALEAQIAVYSEHQHNGELRGNSAVDTRTGGDRNKKDLSW